MKKSPFTHAPPPPINNDDPLQPLPAGYKLGGKLIYLDISLNPDKSIKIDSKLRYILACHMTCVYILFGHLYSKYWLIFGIKTLRKPHLLLKSRYLLNAFFDSSKEICA